MADWKQAVRRVLYPAYEARVVRRLPADRLPKHVGVMLDGNRRWAKAVGADTAQGHRAGAANIEPLPDPSITHPNLVITPHRQAELTGSGTGHIANPEEI